MGPQSITAPFAFCYCFCLAFVMKSCLCVIISHNEVYAREKRNKNERATLDADIITVCQSVEITLFYTL